MAPPLKTPLVCRALQKFCAVLYKDISVQASAASSSRWSGWLGGTAPPLKEHQHAPAAVLSPPPPRTRLPRCKQNDLFAPLRRDRHPLHREEDTHPPPSRPHPRAAEKTHADLLAPPRRAATHSIVKGRPLSKPREDKTHAHTHTHSALHTTTALPPLLSSSPLEGIKSRFKSSASV